MPKRLNFIVAIDLIVIGLVGLFGAGNLRLNQRPLGNAPTPRRAAAPVQR